MEQMKKRISSIRSTGRDDLRGLLGSGRVQALLAAAVVVQGLVAIERVEDRGETNARVAQAAQVRPEVLPPVAVTELAFDAPKAEAGTAKDEALELAEEHSRDGYKVSPELARTIHEVALENGIDPRTAFGLIRAESGFKNSATSPVGAVGLTQLMPKTARWLEPGVTTRELRDPETNLRIGFRYLRDLIEKYDGNERLALVAYNRGPGTVDRAIKRGRNPDNGYADFVYGKKDHGHKLFTR